MRCKASTIYTLIAIDVATVRISAAVSVAIFLVSNKRFDSYARALCEWTIYWKNSLKDGKIIFETFYNLLTLEELELKDVEHSVCQNKRIIAKIIISFLKFLKFLS